MAPEVHVIYGGQFGSEAKRLFTEYYANQFKPDAIVTNALPNSGGFDSNGGKWSALPVGYPCKMMVSPGSAISVDNLLKEMGQLPEEATVFIHKNAAVVQDRHLKGEEKFIRIGSTMTGGAAAVFEKMERNPLADVIAGDTLNKKMHHMVLGNDDWIAEILTCKRILVICAQGHSLSINYGFYPYTTSRNTSPAQAVADAGIPMQWVKKVIGCFRAFPIRVSNRVDEDGVMIGYSGPCYPDQHETSWEELGLEKEYTSVSKKVRRVFTFSHEQLAESVLLNGTTDVFMNFVNYIPTAVKQSNFLKEVTDTLKSVSSVSGISTELSFIGYGPTMEAIIKA